MDALLAVDIGTQSLKAGILDAQLNVLERQQVPLTVRVSSGTHAEMDGEEIWSALVAACKGLDLRNRVEAVVLSTLCPSLLPIDAAVCPLHPVILHLDRRSEKEARWALHTI